MGDAADLEEPEEEGCSKEEASSAPGWTDKEPARAPRRRVRRASPIEVFDSDEAEEAEDEEAGAPRKKGRLTVGDKLPREDGERDPPRRGEGVLALQDVKEEPGIPGPRGRRRGGR